MPASLHRSTDASLAGIRAVHVLAELTFEDAKTGALQHQELEWHPPTSQAPCR